MSDDQKKDNLFKNALNNAGTNLQKQAKDKSKSLAYGIANDAVDILVDSARKFISSIIYPNGDAPRETFRRNGGYDSSDSGRYRDYASYSRSTRRDTVGTQSATDIRLVRWPTKEKAEYAIGQCLKKIDESANNSCRVGDLYELGEPKVPTSITDWKYGWTDKDKGGFDVREITSGQYQGWWMPIVPEPHLL